jgi:hypothetical protein
MTSSKPKSGGGLAQTAEAFMCLRATRLLGLSLAWLLCSGDSLAQDSAPSEYELKAAFLFNFAKYVDWPPEVFAEVTSPLVIGVLGKSPFGGTLERTLQGKAVNDRALTFREVHSLTEATNCHVLFISTSEKVRMPQIFEDLRGTSVLTVGESDRFAEDGGMIGFVLAGNKIRFRVNEEAARKAGLKVSSKLLSLALPPPTKA